MLSILLVGKNPEVLASLADQLSQRDGIAVSRASSGKDVWDILGKSKVDVVVTDEKLADGDAAFYQGAHQTTTTYKLCHGQFSFS
jgi:DNA-binding response OmpR family regulator